MGRRKKEAPACHRETISRAAERLFLARGIAATTMDQIAKEAGYSKATVYVYFQSKEEIVGVLVLKSMQKLSAYLSAALETEGTTREQYALICQGLLRYQEEYPFYFQLTLTEINVDFTNTASLPEERETYRVGEEINDLIGRFLAAGIQAGALRPDLPIPLTVFSFWGMLSGLIQTAANKEAYLRQAWNLSKHDFLAYGFDTLYRSIAEEGKTNGK